MRETIRAFDANRYLAWLRDQGAIILPPTNEYEAARYRIGRGKIVLIYSKPSKGTWTLTGDAIEHHRAYAAGQLLPTIEVIPHDQPVIGDLILYTDASQYHASKAGAWAAILVEPDGSEREISGPLIGDVTSSSAAEMMAVANALHRFLKVKAIRPGATIRVICDNSTVVAYIGRGSPRVKSKSPDLKRALRYILDLAKKYQIRLRTEWVKGHQRLDSKDPRAPFNRRCDKLASAHSKRLNAERTRNGES
jgi:ribonuclease HI